MKAQKEVEKATKRTAKRVKMGIRIEGKLESQEIALSIEDKKQVKLNQMKYTKKVVKKKRMIIKQRIISLEEQLVLRMMEKKEIPLEWLNSAVHYLGTFNVTKAEKLVILKRYMYMNREILDWSDELERDSPDLKYD